MREAFLTGGTDGFLTESSTELNPVPFVSPNFKKNWGLSGDNPCFFCNKDVKKSPAVVNLLESGFITSALWDSESQGHKATCASCAKLLPPAFVFTSIYDPLATQTPAPAEDAPTAPKPGTRAVANARPTEVQFVAYNNMFDYFNAELFGGKLPPIILNLSRKARAHGFFAPSRWLGAVAEGEELSEAMHEISLNPDSLAREPKRVISTLVHEMCHLQRQVTGKPPRGGYHDLAWAEMMLAVGLTPVSIDKPGTMLGQKVTHEIDEKGAFERAFEAMPREYLLPFTHIVLEQGVKKRSTSNKVKYSCSGCDSNIWGKPGLRVICSDCDEEYDEQ